MADDIRSWITKVLIDHDVRHGANFEVPVECKHYCQLLKFYTYRDDQNPRAQIEGSIGDRTHRVKVIFEVEETDKFEQPDPDTGYKHSLTSQLRSIFQIKEFYIRIGPPSLLAGTEIPLVTFFVTKWDVVSGNHDEPVYWLDTCKIGEGNSDGKVREVLKKWWCGESNSEPSQNRSSQNILSQGNIRDMSITAASPKVEKDVVYYHRTTVALGDIVSIEEAKASRVGEWDARSALAWLERNQDTVLNTCAQYRNHPSNNVETIKSSQHSQGKTAPKEPSGNGHPPKSQPTDAVNSRSPHLSNNRRSPSGSSQSHHIPSSSLLRASPTKGQFSREKITNPLSFPSSPATDMSPGNTDEELLSPYEREERRKRGRKSKGVRGDGSKKMEQRSPSSSQLSQLSWMSPSSPTMAMPRKSGAELSQADYPFPELATSGNATTSNARDKWKRPRESLNSRRQSRVVVWDEDEDIAEGPLIKNASKRKIVLSSSEAPSQVIEIQGSSDEENFAQTSNSSTPKRSTRGDTGQTVIAQQGATLRTREATKPIKPPSGSNVLNEINVGQRTSEEGDKREENRRGKGGNALEGKEKATEEEKEERETEKEDEEEEEDEGNRKEVKEEEEVRGRTMKKNEISVKEDNDGANDSRAQRRLENERLARMDIPGMGKEVGKAHMPPLVLEGGSEIPPRKRKYRAEDPTSSQHEPKFGGFKLDMTLREGGLDEARVLQMLGWAREKRQEIAKRVKKP